MQKANLQASWSVILMAFWIFSLTSYLFAQQNPDDLQNNLGDLEVGAQWSYGDLEKGIAVAKETGKPLFVLFR